LLTDCALGADAYWCSALHLYTPLPFRPGKGSFGEYFRTHFFVNAGNLTAMDRRKQCEHQAVSSILVDRDIPDTMAYLTVVVVSSFYRWTNYDKPHKYKEIQKDSY